MKKQTIAALAFILLVGILLGSLVYFGLSTGTEQVVVPAVDISPGETFSADNLKIITIPKAISLEGVMYKKPEEIFGKTALSSLVAGEPITSSKISENASDGFLRNMVDTKNNYTLTLAVPTDVMLRDISTGDFVSVFATYTDDAENIVTGLVGDKYRVVKADEDVDGNIFAVTIEVEPERMMELTYTVMNAEYVLSYVPADHETKTLPGVTHRRVIDRHLLGESTSPTTEVPGNPAETVQP